MDERKLIFNLQLFAQDEPEGQEKTPEEEDGGGEPEEPQKDKKSFTQEDVDKIIGKAYAKWQKQQEKAVSEAERLAKMTEEERQREMSRKREEDLTRREAEIARRELRAQALETLAGKSYPAELADVLDYKDADSCNASIDKVGKAWQKAVQKGVEVRIAGSTPRTGGAGGSRPKNLETAVADFYNMN